MARSERQRPDHEEKPPESGERAKKHSAEQGAETRGGGDQFEQNADRYNEIRDSVGEKRSELMNLKLNRSLEAGSKKEAMDRLQQEMDTLEDMGVQIEKQYGARSMQFAQDASRQKNIKVDMEMASRKMAAIDRVQRRGEFPGGDEAARQAMDVEALRIDRGNRELAALKGMYEGETDVTADLEFMEPAAKEEQAPVVPKPEVHIQVPKRKKKDTKWMTPQQKPAEPTGAAEAAAEDAEYLDVSDTAEFVDAPAKEAEQDMEPFPLERKIEPIPLVSHEQRAEMNRQALDKRDAEELATLEKQLEFFRGATVREEHNLIDNYGVHDPIEAMVERSKKGFFSRALSSLSGRNRALSRFNEASNNYADTLAKINEIKNRTEDPEGFRQARQVGNERRG